jgi:hypothetical protein
MRDRREPLHGANEAGRRTLAQLIESLRAADRAGLSARQSAVRLWPTFREAVASALAEAAALDSFGTDDGPEAGGELDEPPPALAHRVLPLHSHPSIPSSRDA